MFVYESALHVPMIVWWPGQLAPTRVAPLVRARPFLIARYYVLTTASLAAGLWDWLRRGTAAGWEPAEGTR